MNAWLIRRQSVLPSTCQSHMSGIQHTMAKTRLSQMKNGGTFNLTSMLASLHSPMSTSRPTTFSMLNVFPWQDEMGIYFLNGLHSMHCLVSQRLRLSSPKGGRSDPLCNIKTFVEHSSSTAMEKTSPPPSTTSIIAWIPSVKTWYVSPTTPREPRAPLVIWNPALAKCECANSGKSYKTGRSNTRHVSDTRMKTSSTVNWPRTNTVQRKGLSIFQRLESTLDSRHLLILKSTSTLGLMDWRELRSLHRIM